MEYKIQIRNWDLKILTKKSIKNLLEEKGIESVEERTLDHRYINTIRFGLYNRADLIRKVKELLEAYDDEND